MLSRALKIIQHFSLYNVVNCDIIVVYNMKDRYQSMFLKKIKGFKGRTFLQIVNGYRDETGKVKHEVIESLGYLDDLNSQYANPIEHFTHRAKELTQKQDIETTISFNPKKEMNAQESSLRNAGYLALKPILNNLKLKPVFKALEVKHQTQASLEEIFTSLVYAQIIHPSSKQTSFNKKHMFLENYNYSEDQMYRALSYFGESFESIKDSLYKLTDEAYKLETKTTYYDGTNFYFEIDREDNFRRKGPSKELRPNPLVSIGLLADTNGIPIDISIYPGNESEKPHFNQTIKEMKTKNKITGKTIYVADKGLNTAANIYSAITQGDGYIYSQTVKGASELTKKMIESDLGFEEVLDHDGSIDFLIKGFKEEIVLKIPQTSGPAIKFKTEQLKVITWSKKYAEKSKYERDKLILKAKSISRNPAMYKKDQLGVAAKYLKKITYDKHGEIIKDTSELIINQALIDLEARMDGYYLIVTSETQMKAIDVFRQYHNLYDIEETFKVTKLFLKVRPIYLQLEARIKAHVLVAYVSLIILRILKTKILKDAYSFHQIIDGLRTYECAMMKPNLYFFFNYNPVVLELANISGSNVKLETKTLLDIRNLFTNY